MPHRNNIPRYAVIIAAVGVFFGGLSLAKSALAEYVVAQARLTLTESLSVIREDVAQLRADVSWIKGRMESSASGTPWSGNLQASGNPR